MSDVSFTFIKQERFNIYKNINQLGKIVNYINENNIVNNVKNTYTDYNNLGDNSQNEFNNLMHETVKNDVKNIIYDYQKNVNEE
jgi:hypothetical protein